MSSYTNKKLFILGDILYDVSLEVNNEKVSVVHIETYESNSIVSAGSKTYKELSDIAIKDWIDTQKNLELYARRLMA